AAHAPGDEGPAYCCQDDGMIGVGCGARSYTRSLHYSTEYAVRGRGVREILEDYTARPTEAFAQADYGFALSAAEQRRRYLSQSLLQCEGLALSAYRGRFGSDALDDLPELMELPALGLTERDRDRLRLTVAGIELSDLIGPWLYSPEARTLMEGFAWR